MRHTADGTVIVNGVCHRYPLGGHAVSRITFDEQAGALVVMALGDVRVQSVDAQTCFGGGFGTSAVRGVSFRPAEMHVSAEREFLFNGCWQAPGRYSLQQLAWQTQSHTSDSSSDQLAPVKLLHAADAVGLPTALAVLIVRYAHDLQAYQKALCVSSGTLDPPDTILTPFPAYGRVCLRSIRAYGAAHVQVASATHLAPDRLEILAGGCSQVEMAGCQCLSTDVHVQLRGLARFQGHATSLWSNVSLHLQDFAHAEHLAGVLERFAAVVCGFAHLRYDARCVSEPRVTELNAGRATVLNVQDGDASSSKQAATARDKIESCVVNLGFSKRELPFAVL